MAEFIKYTVGLDVVTDRGSQLVKVEVMRNGNGSMFLQAVSGHNLARMPWRKTVTAAEWENRPRSDNSSTEAVWCLRKLGLVV